ncbi:hypothetical protein EZ428_05820 [Pedobacter frigiditerrae]|uniref:Lipoprotein n=1 Tax=Pedobacter frigiditerrae TaxID=2530452 RepID=A0A4R0N6L2_9SPHI|nr:hypothetical protein [Pedobacter frigiditerrae]TCC94292.1 hypothetical protein EZ428_05820 [Pedobacter frigiditerrae]
MRYKYILFFIILLTACQEKREVSTSFYYWKTVYKQNKVENQHLKQFQSKKVYIRMMDVDLDINQKAVPIAPITFTDSIPKNLEIVPVVFIVNEVLKSQSEAQLTQLAYNILAFVKSKVLQSGQKDYEELQIDCDWTVTTRTKYFELLRNLKEHNKTRILSSTLRLHQLKNQEKSGIPPADKVLLMCYNMGNLRQYGKQNSILDVSELQKYAGTNLGFYPMDIDVALPLFSWSVAFRNKQYAGISKRVSLSDLQNKEIFIIQSNGLYLAKTDLPTFGLIKNDEVRYEESKAEDIKKTAEYLSSYLSEKPINLIYYHLDQNLLKNYEITQLEEIADILR